MSVTRSENKNMYEKREDENLPFFLVKKEFYDILNTRMQPVVKVSAGIRSNENATERI